MIRKYSKLDSQVFAISTALSSYFLSASPAFAQSAWGGDCVINGVATIQGIGCLLANIFNVFISVLGIIAFMMLIVGGFKYMLSGGNSKGIESARSTITFAIVGIVVALSAFIILNLIADFTGIETILNFTIPSSETGLPQ